MGLCRHGRFFQQETFSDVELIIQVSCENERQDATELKRMPAHMLVLSASPYLAAQAERWQQQQQQSNDNEADSNRSRRRRPTNVVSLTLPTAGHEPAAMALLAAMYGVKKPAELMQELPQQQRLQAAILGDMLQLPEASEAAVDNLVAAAKAPAGLSVAVLKQFLCLSVVPACLLPLVPHVMEAALKQSSAVGMPAIQASLLSVFGNLDSAWADEQLQRVLLALPLPVMELLLSLDALQVSSECNVLYIAQAYADAESAGLGGIRSQATRAALAQHIRCPHLSLFWLGAFAIPSDLGWLLLSDCTEQLKRLLSMRIANASMNIETIQQQVKGIIVDAPGSWLLPPRQLRALPDGVSLTWRLPVAEVQKVCRRCAAAKSFFNLYSPRSAPLGGLAWRLCLQAAWQEMAAGVELGLFLDPANLRSDCVYSCHAVVKHGGRCIDFDVTASVYQEGYLDFWDLGPITGGWDAAAWAAKGLPSSGDLVLELQVTQVNDGG